MRLVLVWLLLAACGTPEHALTQAQRQALVDFRQVERDCVERFAQLEREYEIELTDEHDLPKLASAPLAAWRAMRTRVEATRFDGELDTTLRRYLDERERAWTMCCNEPTSIDYRTATEAALADAARVAALLAKYQLPALPPPPPAAAVTLRAPPAAPPGRAYVWAGDTVLVVDETGFRVVANDVTSMDVTPDGTLWACGSWHVTRWDGKATDFKTKLYAPLCAADSHGTLWLLVDDLQQPKDQLVAFDGTTWKSTVATVGDPFRDIEGFAIDRDGRTYALSRDHSGGRDRVFVFEQRAWREVELANDASVSTEHLFRGADGKVWLIWQIAKGDEHPYALAELTPAGPKPPVFDNGLRGSSLFAVVDANGVATVLDAQRNVIEQGTLERKLPMAVSSGGDSRMGPASFAFDGSGRIWIDLADGLNVIEPDGKRTVYPRGSIDGIRRPIRAIVVVGGGPKLPAPSPAVTRTITGTLKNGDTPLANVPIAMCSGSSPPCAKGLPHWEATTDAGGRFTLENVPRWRYSLSALVGERGEKHWHGLDGTECCGDVTELSLHPSVVVQ